MVCYKICFDIFFNEEKEFPHLQGTLHCYSDEALIKYKQKVIDMGARSCDVRIYKVETVNL